MGSSALAKDRDAGGVTTKGGNVRLDPLESKDLVAKRLVARDN